MFPRHSIILKVSEETGFFCSFLLKSFFLLDSWTHFAFSEDQDCDAVLGFYSGHFQLRKGKWVQFLNFSYYAKRSPKCFKILSKESALENYHCQGGEGGIDFSGKSLPCPIQKRKNTSTSCIRIVTLSWLRTDVTALVLYSSSWWRVTCGATVHTFVVFQCRYRCRCRTVVRRRRRRALSTCASRPSPSTAASTARQWRTCCKYNVVLMSLLT